jgi:hypothetical protein
MADTVFEQDLNLAAGNGSSAVFFAAVNLGWSDVQEVMIVFPPGCSGLVGIQLQYAVNSVYPNSGNSYYVMDDYILTIPVSGQQQGGQWRIVGYNQDRHAHTVRSYWSYNYLANTQNAASTPLISL